MDTSKYKIFIHVGYGRSASTYCQNIIFPSLEGITFYNKFVPLKEYTRYGRPSFKEAVYSEIKKCDPSKPIFFSDEGLFNHAPLAQITRLKDMLPHATIILTIRSPIDLIISRYNHYVLRGSLKSSLKGYIRKNRLLFMGHYSPLNIVKAFKCFFSNRVKVFVFEEYVPDLVVFGRTLAEEVFGVTLSSSHYQNEVQTRIETSNVEELKNYSFFALQGLFRFVNFLTPPGRYLQSIFYNFKRILIRKTAGLEEKLNDMFPGIKQRRKRKDRLTVSREFSFCLDPENRELEKLLGKKLPDSYFYEFEQTLLEKVIQSIKNVIKRVLGKVPA